MLAITVVYEFYTLCQLRPRCTLLLICAPPSTVVSLRLYYLHFVHKFWYSLFIDYQNEIKRSYSYGDLVLCVFAHVLNIIDLFYLKKNRQCVRLCRKLYTEVNKWTYYINHLNYDNFSSSHINISREKNRLIKQSTDWWWSDSRLQNSEKMWFMKCK